MIVLRFCAFLAFFVGNLGFVKHYGGLEGYATPFAKRGRMMRDLLDLEPAWQNGKQIFIAVYNAL